LLEDQRFVDHRPDVLSWKTETLTEDVTVTGNIFVGGQPLTLNFIKWGGSVVRVTNNTFFVVVGAVSAAEVREQLERHYAASPRRSLPPGFAHPAWPRVQAGRLPGRRGRGPPSPIGTVACPHPPSTPFSTSAPTIRSRSHPTPRPSG
jgi:hypothetical protein